MKIEMFSKLFQFLKLKQTNFLGSIELSYQEYLSLVVNYKLRYFFYGLYFLFGILTGGVFMGFMMMGFFK